jgi:PAS domain-containing protein
MWIRDEAIPVEPDDEGHALFQGVMFDITERKLAEERRQKAEENYRTLVEQRAVIAVEEDGPGVPLELRHDIFEPFRLDRRRPHPRPGRYRAVAGRDVRGPARRPGLGPRTRRQRRVLPRLPAG